MTNGFNQFKFTPISIQPMYLNFVMAMDKTELVIYSKDFFKKAFPETYHGNVPASLSFKLEEGNFYKQQIAFTQNLALLDHAQNIKVIPTEEKNSLTILSPNLSETLVEMAHAGKTNEIFGNYWPNLQTMICMGKYPLEQLNKKSIFDFIWK